MRFLHFLQLRRKQSALQCVLNALTPRPALDKSFETPSSRWNPQTGRIFRDNTREGAHFVLGTRQLLGLL